MTQHAVDLYWLRWACQEAQDCSRDPRTTVGAVIVKSTPHQTRFGFVDYGIRVATGANHFPDGVIDTPARWERHLKSIYVEHAERNAIYKAARLGRATSGATLYATWFACTACCRAIIQAGIRRCVGLRVPDHLQGAWTVDIVRGREMLQEAGIECAEYADQLFPDRSVRLRFDDQEFYP